MNGRTLSALKVLCALAIGQAFPVQLMAGDVGFFGILKLQYLTQAPGAAPVSLASNGFSFQAFVMPAANGAVTNASVKPGNTTPSRALLPDPATGILRFEENFDSALAREMVYPTSAGSPIAIPVNYKVTMETVHDGTNSAFLSFYLLPAFLIPISQPSTPVIQNLIEGQAIDSSADFPLRWSFSGGNALDVVQLLVLDSVSNVVFASPVPFQPQALNGTSNSIVLPAYGLPAAADLIGHLLVARPGFTNSADGALGFPALAKDVAFPLVTRPAPAPPRLEVLSTNAAPLRLGFLGETNRNYHLHATTNFQSWQDLFITNSPTGWGTFTDPINNQPGHRFYRIQVGP